MEPKIFESHAHYDSSKFQEDRAELLSTMQENGIGTIVNVGATWKSVTEVVELAEKYPLSLSKTNKFLSVSSCVCDVCRTLSPPNHKLSCNKFNTIGCRFATLLLVSILHKQYFSSLSS